MKRYTLLSFVALLAAFAIPWFAVAQPPEARNFVAHLSGDEEVPPVDTQAQGQVIFQLDQAGDEFRFLLLVAHIQDVTQAHIHCGPEGANGPVVVFLYPPAPPPQLIPGSSNGVLAQGTFTNTNIIPRPDSPECPGGVADFADLIGQMLNGNTYANVHTLANPGGEIRGQTAVAGPQP